MGALARAAGPDRNSILQCSGQFDLEAVTCVKMQRMGFKTVENLAHLAPNLIHLDLAHNRIHSMKGLETLQKLTKLVLSDNELKKISHIDDMNSLETLSLQGNKISDLDSVAVLAKLPKLHSLQFQEYARPGEEIDEEDRNPICSHPSYRVAVRRMVPQLTALDGQRIAFFDDVDEGPIDFLETVADVTPEDWFSPQDLTVEGDTQSMVKGMTELEAALAKCQRVNARAKALVEDC